MDFHAKVPLVVFLGVMYLWIAFTEAIFGGTRAATNVATAYLAKDKRQDYGERRFRVLDCIGGRLYASVFTPRADKLHVISLRKANSREVRLYEKALKS